MQLLSSPYSCSTSLAGALRPAPGNVHSANEWEGVLKPVVARYQGKVSRIYFRADAGFANPEVYEYLEGEGIKYVVRLPANRVLRERMATCSLPGRASAERGAPFLYELHPSSRNPDEAASRRRQGRIASRANFARASASVRTHKVVGMMSGL
jgi:Transposase DDE domain group 1